MNLTFKAPLMKEWTVLDNSVVVGGKEIPFSSMIRVEYTGMPTGKTKNGVIQFFTSPTKFYTLVFPYKQKEDGDTAGKYILQKFYEINKKEIDEANKEHRMRCNVCGHVFCYNSADVRENEALIKQARSNARAGAVNALFGTDLNAHAFTDKAERALDKIKDFSRCPKCNSTNLTELSDSEPAMPASPATVSVSSADELKKFKELLDMGAITQEEFDAKKKQILGI